MRRSLNFTDREEIKDIQHMVVRQNEDPEKIVIKSIDIGDYANRNDCLLFVETYHGTELERYALGNTNRITLPYECDINKLAYKDRLKLRIIIVDSKTKRILAHKDNVRVFGNESSILLTCFSDIGNKIWTIKYDGDDGEPKLYINNKIHGIQYHVKTNPFLRLSIFPNIIREILKHIFFEDRIESLNSPQNEWHEKWLKFISNTLNITFPDLPDPFIPHEFAGDINQWIDDVVDKFCENNADYFNQLLLDEES